MKAKIFLCLIGLSFNYSCGEDNTCSKEDYAYKYIGKRITQAYGSDLTGSKIGSLVAPEAGHIAEQYEHVLAWKRPVNDEGEIHISKNHIIKYRQILLPLGDNGISINAILGGMSYKIFENEPTKSIFSFFRGKE